MASVESLCVQIEAMRSEMIIYRSRSFRESLAHPYPFCDFLTFFLLSGWTHFSATDQHFWTVFLFPSSLFP
jgi:hypothetical protein